MRRNNVVDESKIIGRFMIKYIPNYSLIKIKGQSKSVLKIDDFRFRDRVRQNWFIANQEELCYLIEV